MSDFTLILFTLSAGPVSYLFTRIMIVISHKTAFVNNPNLIVESHQEATPYGGGIAIGLTIIAFIVTQYSKYDFVPEFLIIFCAILLSGVLDDLFHLSPLKKLLSQMLVGILFLFLFIQSSIFILFFFLIIILSSQNAWNLIDIMDGLTAGISIIIFLAVGIILLPNEEFEFYSLLAFVTAFSVLGFRFLNVQKAKIFLGETGTLLLGSLFAFIFINTFLANKNISILLLLLGIVPFFELIFLIIVRTKKRIPFWHGSSDHFALRMSNNGYAVKEINRKVIIFSSIYSSMIIITSFYHGNEIVLYICCSVALLILASAYFYFNSLPARNIVRHQ